MTEDTYRDKLNSLQVEIEALRAKLKESQTGDLISRAAALTALTSTAGVGNRALDKIRSLPSAHCDYCPYPDDYDGRVAVVRCKDCKHYENDVMGNPWGVCCHLDWITDNCGCLVDENGWCYRAERRGE